MINEHVALYVKYLEKAKEFFIRYFNGTANAIYHNKEKGFQSYFITFDDGARMEIMTRPDVDDREKRPFRTGFAHLAFSVGSKEEVDRITKLLQNDGYQVTSGPRTTGDGYYESCILDSEGNQIEITV